MVTIHDFTVSQVFQSARHIPDHGDQVYDWSAERVKDLVQGLIASFHAYYKPHHGMADCVKHYPIIKFGSLSLKVVGEDRAFLDGHKFFITLTLLLINVHVLQSRRIYIPMDPVELEDLFRFFRKDCGEWTINPDFECYGNCLRDLIRGKEMRPGQVPLPALNLVARYNDIDDILREEIDDRALPFFAAWLRDKLLIEVRTAEDEREARLLKSAMAYERLRVAMMRALSEEQDW